MSTVDRRFPVGLPLLLILVLLAAVVGRPALVRAAHTPPPLTVAIAGSMQSELGCPGDWQPDCAASELILDASDGVWQASFDLPAGNWEYKAALNDSWDENYGANAQQNGPNIALALDEAGPVKFYYDPTTHWVTSNRNAVIAVAPGSFQSELGCPGDWQPDCLRSWLQDPDGDGTYTFTTNQLPAGAYEAKVALNESWDLNYGAAGVQNGPNIAFTVTNNGDAVTFRYDAASHLLTISAGAPPDEELVALVAAPARHPIEDSVFYFVMPDRFDNGNSNNDQGGLSGDRLVTGFDPTDKGFYHGGDAHVQKPPGAGQRRRHFSRLSWLLDHRFYPV
ncbi:MAG TPA: hypothetical protein PKE45_20100 [Caldilineaceae bacterium]|nr:hypothetical protein [Caldilineaceae bacterium]